MINMLTYYRWTVVFVLLTGWTVASCSSSPSQPPNSVPSSQQPQTDSSSVQNSDRSKQDKVTQLKKPETGNTALLKESSIASSINPFAINAYQKLSSKEGNLFLSPYNISSAFALVYKGAKENTQQQMSNIFLFDTTIYNKIRQFQNQLNVNDRNDFYQFSLINDIYMQKGQNIQPDFTYYLLDNWNGLRLSQEDFGSNSEVARKNINRLTSQKTQGRIKEILASGSLSDQTKLVLISAIYFKGAWESPFDEGQTKKAVFHVSDKQTTEVPMMAQKYTANYFEDDLVQWIELPYKGKTSEQQELSMVVLLPKDSHRLKEVEKNIDHWLSPKQVNKQLVSIYLPKFTLESDVKLVDMLKEMGLTDIFNPQLSDLSGISKDLFISYASHKAFIEVNERGTEATASTAISVTSRGVSPSPQKEFRADHPFIFWIKDNVYETVLFIGRVAVPR